jgi:hypothetical protein
MRRIRRTRPPGDGVGRSERDIAELAASLIATCASVGLPHPSVALPTRDHLRRVNPTLANRIEALRGRNGYRRLARFVGAPAPLALRRNRGATRSTALWMDIDCVRQALRPYQNHPNVLPRIGSLSAEMRAVVRRLGGSEAFCKKAGMLGDAEWRTVCRFSTFLTGLVLLMYANHDPSSLPGPSSHPSPPSMSSPSSTNPLQGAGPARQPCMPPLHYRVENESRGLVPFPSTRALVDAGLYPAVQRYGGRHALIFRLGFARGSSPIFMGSFSVSYAAELLVYATEVATCTSDGYVGMPSRAKMSADGRLGLSKLTRVFGGEVEVGRRCGLVPIPNDYVTDERISLSSANDDGKSSCAGVLSDNNNAGILRPITSAGAAVTLRSQRQRRYIESSASKSVTAGAEVVLTSGVEGGEGHTGSSDGKSDEESDGNPKHVRSYLDITLSSDGFELVG